MFWKWSSVTVHVSAVLSIISSVLYFGWWMMNFYKVIIATVVGGGLGILIGYSYETKPLQLVLFFIASSWVNKMPGWDRSSMVLGTLAMILGSVWPNLTDGQVLGRKAFQSILAIQLLSLMTSSTVNAFKSYDYLDLHCAEFDQWLTDVRAELAMLRQLQVYIDYERMIFWNVANFPAALSIFIDIAELLIQELIGLQTMVKSITYNHTQEIFVEVLTPVLVEMNEEMEIALTLVGEYFETFHPFPDAIQSLKRFFSRGLEQAFGDRQRHHFETQRRKMKSFYDVPCSKDLIDMHRLHHHEDPLDHKVDVNDDDGDDNGVGVGGVDGVSAAGSLSGNGGRGMSQKELLSSDQDSSTKSRDRSLTEMHGFHHYHFTEDVETGKEPATVAMNKAETETAGSQSHVSSTQATRGGGGGGGDGGGGSTGSATMGNATGDGGDADEENGGEANEKDTPLEDPDEERIRLFDQCIHRLCQARAQLLYSFNEVRRKYVFGSIDGETAGPYGDHSVSGLFPPAAGSKAAANKGTSTTAPPASSTAANAAMMVDASGSSSRISPLGPPSLQPPTSTDGTAPNNKPRQRKGKALSPPTTPASVKPFTLSQKYELEVQLANEIFELDPHRHPHHPHAHHHPGDTDHDPIDHEEALAELDASLAHSSAADDDLSSSFNMPEISIFTSDPRKKRFLILATREENVRLSLRNLGPRAAYMHRMSIVVEYASSLRMVFKEQGRPFSWERFLHSNAVFLWEYCLLCMLFWWTLVRFIGVTLWQMVTCSWQYAETKKTVVTQCTAFVEHNAQALKISAATTLGLSLRIFELMPGFYQGGLWVALVMALIRQDNSASSFLTAYQRLEGTVIGAIFSVLLTQVFACATHTCGDELYIPALTIWVTICAFFREGPQHGYAAVVAAFTPIVLLLGTKTSLNSAWGRIVENFIGIAIYLAIDNLILPKRTYPMIKILVLKGIDETRVMFSESVKAVEELIGPRVLEYMNQHSAELLAQQKRQQQQQQQEREREQRGESLEKEEDGGQETGPEGEEEGPTPDGASPFCLPTGAASPIETTATDAVSAVTKGANRVRVNSCVTFATEQPSPTAAATATTTRKRTITSETHAGASTALSSALSSSSSAQPPETAPLLGMYGSSTDVRRRAFSCVSNTSSSAAMVSGTTTTTAVGNSGVASSSGGGGASGSSGLFSQQSMDPQYQLGGYLQSGQDEPEIVLSDFSEDQYRIVSASSPYSRVPPTTPPAHGTSAMATGSASATAGDSEIMKDMFMKCTNHLNNAEQQLRVLKGQLGTQGTLLSMVVYEPEMFHRPFPLAAYQRLYQAFVRVHRSAIALNSGSRAFAVIFKQMMRNHENVGPYLKNFTYMSKHMFIAAAKAEVALRSALDALSMVYDRRDFHAELTSLLTLRRVCDRLIHSVDEHFRTKYLRQSVDVLTKFNPYFIVAWQNVFEATTDMIHDLSELGMALLIVRNAEALSYV
eukprot:gene6124-4399_t